MASGALTIAHLMFVDDTLLFCKVSTFGVKAVKRILMTFMRMSVLLINTSKLSIFLPTYKFVGQKRLVYDIMGL